jgi:hypothetical protein
MTFDFTHVTPLDAIRCLSFLVNLVIFVQWIKSRVVLNSFLVGKWEGVFMPSDDKDDVISCTLYVAAHKDADDSAHLFYCKEHLASSETRVKGVDRLVTYDSNPLFIFNKTWRPKFIRVLHKNGVYVNDQSREHPASYNWDCEIISLLFNPKMKVVVQVKDSELTFSGTLRKV